jgi:hypothetical protein
MKRDHLFLYGVDLANLRGKRQLYVILGVDSPTAAEQQLKLG